jgi:hypothetical protein
MHMQPPLQTCPQANMFSLIWSVGFCTDCKVPVASCTTTLFLLTRARGSVLQPIEASIATWIELRRGHSLKAPVSGVVRGLQYER